MKKTLHFEVLIDAPRRAVWNTMLDAWPRALARLKAICESPQSDRT